MNAFSPITPDPDRDPADSSRGPDRTPADGRGSAANGAPARLAGPAPSPSREMAPSGLDRMLWWCAGVTPHIMIQRGCRTDWGRYSALGAVTLATALVAMLNGATVAYFFIVNRNLLLALPAGVGWGLIVLSLDRLLLTSLAKKPGASGTALALMAAPRVALAVLIAMLVSTPAELVVFHHQLDIQVALDQQAQVLTQKAQLDRRYAPVDELKARRDAFEAEVADARLQANAAFAAAACEGDGSCGSGLRGAGELHEEKIARFRQLDGEARRLETLDRPRVADLEARISAMEAQRDAELGRFQAIAVSGDDVLSRLLALRHLEADSVHGATVTGAKWLIRLLSLAIELLPLLTKIYTRGPYDAAFLAERDGECARFDSLREAAVERASTRLEQDRMLGRAVLDASAALMHQAVADSLGSEAAAAAREALAREVLDRAVAVARRTAAEVFGDDRLEDDVTAAALAERRRADERVAEIHGRAAGALDELDRHVRAAEGLAETEVADGGDPDARNVADRRRDA